MVFWVLYLKQVFTQNNQIICGKEIYLISFYCLIKNFVLSFFDHVTIVLNKIYFHGFVLHVIYYLQIS